MSKYSNLGCYSTQRNKKQYNVLASNLNKNITLKDIVLRISKAIEDLPRQYNQAINKERFTNP
jgi:hypothetical protein